VIALLVQPIGPLDHDWDPLLVGLAFTAAAALTGRCSPLWGAGLVVGFWGLSKVIAVPLALTWAGPFSSAMFGVGGLVAADLASRSFAVSPASVAAPVVFIGLGQYVHSTFPGSRDHHLHRWPRAAVGCGRTREFDEEGQRGSCS